MSTLTNLEPQIKIIPPNPVTHSILLVYCFLNNKALPFQARWTSINSCVAQNLQSNTANRQNKIQMGNSYKCSPLDFNQIIQVQVTCEYLGKIIKLTARTENVKLNSQLLRRKNQQKWVPCKIKNLGCQIQCTVGLDATNILVFTCGSRQFNLQLHPQNIEGIMPISFKSSIQTHRYEFLTFFHDCLVNAQRNKPQVSLNSFFLFLFPSQTQKDLTLLKISQNSQLSNQRIESNFKNRQTLPINHIKMINSQTSYYFQNNSQINLQIKSHNTIVDSSNTRTKRSFNQFKKNNDLKEDVSKNQRIYRFKTTYPKPVKVPSQVKVSSSIIQKNMGIGQKLKLKIKLSQKIIKKNQTQNNHFNESGDKNNFKINNLTIIQLNKDKFTLQKEKKIKKSLYNQTKSYLNIFDQEQAISQPQQLMQSSFPEFFNQLLVKKRFATNYVQSSHGTQVMQDLPSINLRESFEELQKNSPNIITSNKKTKQKLKTQINGEFNSQQVKYRQKTLNLKVLSNQTIENEQSLNQQLSELKKQNIEIRKQLQNMHSISKQNKSLKKKYYQLSEQLSRLQLQRKQILSDKLKCESNYHKQRNQKQSLKKQLQQVLKILQQKDSYAEFEQADRNLQQRQKNKATTLSHTYRADDSQDTPTFKNIFAEQRQQLEVKQDKKSEIKGQSQQDKLQQSEQSSIEHPNRLLNMTNTINKQTTLLRNQGTVSSNNIVLSNNIISINNTPSINKTVLSNLDTVQYQRNMSSNTHSRKELIFPTYSHKYPTNGLQANNI